MTPIEIYFMVHFIFAVFSCLFLGISEGRVFGIYRSWFFAFLVLVFGPLVLLMFIAHCVATEIASMFGER